MINNSLIFYSSFNLVVRREERSSSFYFSFFFQKNLFSGLVMCVCVGGGQARLKVYNIKITYE